MHPPHGRCPVRAGLGSAQQRLEVAQQVDRIVLCRLSVHAHSPVRTRAVERPVKPFEVHEVRQGSESRFGKALRTLRYSLLLR